MKKKLKIGWQKYEDLVEQQMSSPLIGTLMENIMSQMMSAIPIDENEDEDEDEVVQMPAPMMIPMSQQLIEDISMLSNYDCWMGHTNFDITNRIKETLDSIDGVEILKICSRYRFFIGVGQMFNFSEVRKSIENAFINKKEM